MITSNLIIIIASMVITIAIILFYVLFISKLKFSETTINESSNEEIPKKNKIKPVLPAEKNLKPLSNYPSESGKNSAPKTVGQVKSLKEETGKVEKKEETSKIKENVFSEPSVDQKETDQSKDARKSFFLYGKVEFEGCKFKYGYLKTMPKYKPIPDECFGCPHILECVGSDGKKSDNYVSQVSKEHYRY